MKRLFVPLLLLAATPGLSGCVAAAVPIAAGLAMGRQSLKDDKPEASKAAANDAEESPVAEGASGEESDNRDETGSEIAAGTETEAVALASADAATVAPLPEMRGPAGPTTEEERTFSALFAKVTAIAQADPFTEEKRKSAILADPGAMTPERAECAFAQTAVLVDLDPGEDAAPLGESVTAPEPLTRVLAALRAQEVAVLWLSRHTAVRAGSVRRALLRSGLDTLGNDELYLVRYEQETKATRRADAAADYCIVAILGDEKRDFDELYSYLKNPDAALPFDELYGEAWFVAPAPLTTTSSPEEG
ncbi:hypothetical protein AAG612_15555 [Citromicrobium bathyomarinum]|uniref:hypothetical protein n=1 Tax=Citromicrobium bathyomarinum TaxID=72174 RepID=UPI003159B2B1